MFCDLSTSDGVGQTEDTGQERLEAEHEQRQAYETGREKCLFLVFFLAENKEQFERIHHEASGYKQQREFSHFLISDTGVG